MCAENLEESPDKDKTLELTDDKPAKMGEGEELVEGKEGEETTLPDTGKGEEGKLPPEIEALMKKKGFKDLSEVANAYEAQEKKQTESDKDARLRSFIPSEIPERPKTERTFTEVPTLIKEPVDMTKEEFEDYQGKREKRFKEELTAMYEDAEADKKWKRDHEEVMRVVNKDPRRFEEIKPQMRIAYQKYPNAPIEELYSMADEMEKEEAKERTKKITTDIFGGDIDPDKLKVLLSKLKPAEISGAPGAGGTGAKKPKAEDAIWGSIQESDTLKDK